MQGLKTHGLWALGLVGAFLLGNQQSTILKTTEEQVVNSSSSPSLRTIPDDSSNRAGSGRTSNRQDRSEDLVSQIFNSATFSESGIEALTTEALKDPNPVKRRLAFSKLLEGMTPENAAAIRDQLITSRAGGSEWRDFNYAWGAIAGADAFNDSVIAERKDLESLISGWAAVDPSGAIAMLTNLPADMADQKNRLEAGIVSGLADRDKDEAVAYVSSLVANGRKDPHVSCDASPTRSFAKTAPKKHPSGLPHSPMVLSKGRP